MQISRWRDHVTSSDFFSKELAKLLATQTFPDYNNEKSIC